MALDLSCNKKGKGSFQGAAPEGAFVPTTPSGFMPNPTWVPPVPACPQGMPSPEATMLMFLQQQMAALQTQLAVQDHRHQEQMAAQHHRHQEEMRHMQEQMQRMDVRGEDDDHASEGDDHTSEGDDHTPEGGGAAASNESAAANGGATVLVVANMGDGGDAKAPRKGDGAKAPRKGGGAKAPRKGDGAKAASHEGGGATATGMAFLAAAQLGAAVDDRFVQSAATVRRQNRLNAKKEKEAMQAQLMRSFGPANPTDLPGNRENIRSLLENTVLHPTKVTRPSKTPTPVPAACAKEIYDNIDDLLGNPEGGIRRGMVGTLQKRVLYNWGRRVTRVINQDGNYFFREMYIPGVEGKNKAKSLQEIARNSLGLHILVGADRNVEDTYNISISAYESNYDPDGNEITPAPINSLPKGFEEEVFWEESDD